MASSSKSVLVTGASSGIGEATARHLARLGHKVTLGARRLDRIIEIVNGIRATGGEAEAARLDVTSRTDFENFVAKAHERFGKVDVLVNNAGIMSLSLLENLKVDEWDRMIDVNVRGVLNGIAAVHPIMAQQGAGHVVNIASVAAYRVDPTAAVYCATKAAVSAISEGLRQESRSIRVTVVSPGLTRSELLEGTTAEQPRQMLRGMFASLAIPPLAIAEAIAFAISQPDHVDVNEMVVRPTAQG